MTNAQDALLLAIAGVAFWLAVLALLAFALIRLFLFLERRERQRR